MKVPLNGKICVIGSGISGLSYAYNLNKIRPDIKIDIIEKSSRVGGWINSQHRYYDNNRRLLLERGPRTLRGKSDGSVVIFDMMKDISGDKEGWKLIRCVPKDSNGNKQYIINDEGIMKRVPYSIMTFLKFIINNQWIIKSFWKDIIINKNLKKDVKINDESVGMMLRRRFGNDDMSNKILSAIFHGVYGGNIHTMSSNKTGYRFNELENKYGSLVLGGIMNGIKMIKNKDKIELSDELNEYCEIMKRDKQSIYEMKKSIIKYPMFSIKGGLGMICEMIYDKLNKNDKIRFKFNTEINKISQKMINEYDHIRITVNPGQYDNYKIIPDKKVEEIFNKIKSESIYIINIYIPGKNHIKREQEGFGYLVPLTQGKDSKLLGVIFDSVIEQHSEIFTKNGEMGKFDTYNDEYTKITMMMGGHYLRDDKIIIDEKRLVQDGIEEVNKHLKTKLDTTRPGVIVQCTLAKDGIPQFATGYERMISDAQSRVQARYADKISFGGVAFAQGGPGVPSVVLHEVCSLRQII